MSESKLWMRKSSARRGEIVPQVETSMSTRKVEMPVRVLVYG
jgi:hypothetical protein